MANKYNLKIKMVNGKEYNLHTHAKTPDKAIQMEYNKNFVKYGDKDKTTTYFNMAHIESIECTKIGE